MGIGKRHATGSELVNIRSFPSGVLIVGRDIADPKIVGENDHHIRSRGTNELYRYCGYKENQD